MLIVSTRSSGSAQRRNLLPAPGSSDTTEANRPADADEEADHEEEDADDVEAERDRPLRLGAEQPADDERDDHGRLRRGRERAARGGGVPRPLRRSGRRRRRRCRSRLGDLLHLFNGHRPASRGKKHAAVWIVPSSTGSGIDASHTPS